MTEQVKCLEPTATVDVAAKTMKDNNIGPVPIVDSVNDMHVVGIVTDRDLAIKVLASDMDARATRVEDVMTADPITCHSQDDVEEALRLMEECRVRRIPVVDENERLVGIIAQADIATRLGEASKTAEVVEEISKDEPKLRHH